MLIVSGRVRDVMERQAGAPGNEWTEQTIVVEDWGQTLYVVASRDFVQAGLPAIGEVVALDVSVRSYVKKDGKPGHGFTGHRHNREVEAALAGSRSATV